jgi:hypothetical protein
MTKPTTKPCGLLTPQLGKKPLPASELLVPGNSKGQGKATDYDDAEAPARSEKATGGGGASEYLRVHLFVAALGDGEVKPDINPKTRDMLQQIIKKVSKEQNTVVTVVREGPLHIQLRVFVASRFLQLNLLDLLVQRYKH